VGLNKTKDQLSVVEDRAKQLSLDLQRTQMDLFAKTSEPRLSNLAVCFAVCLVAQALAGLRRPTGQNTSWNSQTQAGLHGQRRSNKLAQIAPPPGECKDIESQLAESKATVGALTGDKGRLEVRLAECEELLATVQGERDGLKGGLGVGGGGIGGAQQPPPHGRRLLLESSQATAFSAHVHE
jgi:hypothetical protein